MQNSLVLLFFGHEAKECGENYQGAGLGVTVPVAHSPEPDTGSGNVFLPVFIQLHDKLVYYSLFFFPVYYSLSRVFKTTDFRDWQIGI